MPDEVEPVDILFTSPHPDDLEIFMGGTIAKTVQLGFRVAMIHTTTGEPTPRGSEEQRSAEAAKAADVLGVRVMEILSLPNRELTDCPQNRYVLGTVFRKYRPKVVVTLAGRTPMASPDHWETEFLSEASAFYSRLTKWDDRFDDTQPHTIKHLVYRQIPRALQTVEWPTSFVVDIKDTIERKLEAVACYESQFIPERIELLHHWLRSTAGYEGSVAGVAYGETFQLARPLGTQDMVQFLA